MATFKITPAIARAEISRRKNNKVEGVTYEPPADPSLLKLGGSALRTIAGTDVKATTPKATTPKAKAVKATKTVKVTKAKKAPKNPEANAAFQAAFAAAPEGQKRRAAGKAYRAVMEAQAAIPVDAVVNISDQAQAAVKLLLDAGLVSQAEALLGA